MCVDMLPHHLKYKTSPNVYSDVNVCRHAATSPKI